MPGKYSSSEKKARIHAWRQEKVSMKEICACSGRAKVNSNESFNLSQRASSQLSPQAQFGGG